MKFMVNLILCFLGQKNISGFPTCTEVSPGEASKISSYDESMELYTYIWLVDLYVKM